MKLKTYCFDIDGVICNVTVDYKDAEPNEEVIAAMHRLYNDGNVIKLQTARGMGRTSDNVKEIPDEIKDLTLQQLEEWDVPFDALYFGKVAADVYIDDKGLCFEGPDSIQNVIK